MGGGEQEYLPLCLSTKRNNASIYRVCTKLGCAIAVAIVLLLSLQASKICLVKSQSHALSHAVIISPSHTSNDVWYNRYRCNGTGINSSYKNAVVSMLSSEEYLRGVLALGESVREHTPQNYALVALILEDNQLSQQTLDSLTSRGWDICLVPRIPPPKEEIVPARFRDQFTKFALWTWVEFERVVYFDGDCLVIGDISELFGLKDSFGAVRDYSASGEFEDSFNMGVFSIRPDIWEFARLMDMKTWFFDFNTDSAEQGFLQAVYRPWNEVDMRYNAMLAIFQQDNDLWETRKKSFRVIHYTMEKPFLAPSEDSNLQLKDLDISRPIEYWKAYARAHGI